MENEILIEELLRINQIMNNKKGVMIMESKMLFEGHSWGDTLIDGVSRMFDRNAQKEAEKVFDRNPGTFAEKLERYVTTKMATQVGKQELKMFIKNIAKKSNVFRKEFVEYNKEFLDNIHNHSPEKFDEIIENSFGEDILKEYKIHSTPHPRPPHINPIPGPTPTPAELTDIKDFQDWLNITKPGWYLNKNMPETSKYYGKFDKKTEKLWNQYGDDYLKMKNPVIIDDGVEKGISYYLTKIVSSPIKSVGKTFSEMINNTSLSDIQDMLIALKNSFKTVETLHTEFDDSVNIILDKVYRADSKVFGEDYHTDVLKCAQILTSINKFWTKRLPKTFFDNWKLQLKSKLPSKEYYKFEEIINKAQQEGRTKEIFEGLFTKREWWYAFNTEFKAMSRISPFRLNPFQKKGLLFIKNPKEVDWAGLGRFVLTLDARTSKEWKSVQFSRGAQRDLVANIIFRYASHAYLVPIYVETLSYCFRAIGSGVETVINLFKTYDINLVDFNEGNIPMSHTMEIIKTEWADNIVERMPELSQIPGEILGQFTSLREFIKSNSLAKDVWNKVVQPTLAGFTGGVFTKGDEETLKRNLRKWGDDFGEEWEKYKRSLTDEERKIAEEYENLHKKGVDGSKEILFTSWCLKTGKNKQSWDTTNDYGITTDGIKWKKNPDNNDFIQIENSDNINKFENTPIGFQAFCAKNNFKIVTEYITGGVAKTEEPDPNGAKTNDWWFNPTTNTFESY